jgi:hypothetical protein
MEDLAFYDKLKVIIFKYPRLNISTGLAPKALLIPGM